MYLECFITQEKIGHKINENTNKKSHDFNQQTATCECLHFLPRYEYLSNDYLVMLKCYTPLPARYVVTTIKSFQMRHCMRVHLWRIRNTRSQNQKLQKPIL